jgi:hypothetical protein
MTQHPTGKKLVCLIVTLLLLFSVFASVSADGGHDPFEKEVGDYKVNLVVEEPVKAGSHEIVIKLRTEQGEPVDGASVQVEVAKEDDHAEEESDYESEEQKAGDHGSTKTTEKEDNHAEEETGVIESDEHDLAQPVTFESGHEPGEYHGSIDLPDDGEWEIIVHFEVDHEENVVHFPIEVQPVFSKAGILAGFLGVNVAAVAVAGVQKRNQIAQRKAAAMAKKDGVAKKADLAKSDTNPQTEREL